MSATGTAAKKGTINGVNVDTLFATIDAIREQPVIANFQFRARNAWSEGGYNQTTIEGFDGACQRHERPATFVMDADEPPLLLGTDRAANPVEHALHALAACVTTSLVYHAAARGVTIRSVRSQLEGDLDLRGFLGLDPGVRNGYQQVRIKLSVEADAPRETIDELVKIAQARSPVFDIFTNRVPVDVTLG